MNQHEQMIAAAQAAIASQPQDSDLHIQLGMAYFEAERLDEASTAFHHALALNPKAAAAYNGIGRICYHTGPPAAAIAAYEQAIALDPHYIAPFYGLGILYSAQLGDYAQAVAAFQRGLQHNPGDAFLTASLGSTYARMGIIVNTTPAEAGWEGHLTLEFSNSSGADCRIYANEGVCQLLFFEGEPCETTYKDRNGKYQDQPEKVVLARV